MASAASYHCLCDTLLLVTNYDLDQLPVRSEPALDRAKILALEIATSPKPHSKLLNTSLDPKAVIIRMEDGFEKRELLRCNRCNLTFAYKIVDATDKNQSNGSKTTEHVYVLADGLVPTSSLEIR